MKEETSGKEGKGNGCKGVDRWWEGRKEGGWVGITPVKQVALDMHIIVKEMAGEEAAVVVPMQQQGGGESHAVCGFLYKPYSQIRRQCGPQTRRLCKATVYVRTLYMTATSVSWS